MQEPIEPRLPAFIEAHDLAVEDRVAHLHRTGNPAAQCISSARPSNVGSGILGASKIGE
jgi:hypothetical protein